MAAMTGRSGVMQAVTTGGVLAAVSELKAWSIEESMDSIESSTMSASGYKSFISGLKGWSGSCEVNWEPGDTAQADLLIGETIDLELWPAGTSTTTKLAGSAVVTGVSRSAGAGDLVGSSISFQGSGALTITA